MHIHFFCRVILSVSEESDYNNIRLLLRLVKPFLIEIYIKYYILANSLFSHWKRFSNQIFIDCTSFSYAPQIVLLGQV